MKKLLIVRLIIIVALGDVAKSGDLALNWTSSSVFPNGTVVKAYFGDNVTFPWEFDIHTPEGFVMNSTEEFVMNSTEECVIEWTKTSENNSDQNILALLAKNSFIGLSRERHVEFLPNAGINLPNVTMADSGAYTVEITLFGQGKSYNQVAFLQVYGLFDLKWKSSSVFPNGTVVKAYVGDNVTFPWEIDIHTPEEFVIEWTKTSENNPDQNKLSVLAKDIFYGLSRERDVEFLPNAGIKLPKVTMADNGVYTIEIIVFDEGMSYNQVAFLEVSERWPSSCVDVQKVDNVSGVHTIFVNGNKPVKVYCDQSTDNGGWTVIQRRQDGSVDFYRNWEQYENGFGDLNGEFWIGLANLHQLTTAKTVKLRVDLMDVYNSTGYSVYNTFNISGADDNYRLYVSGYSGTAGDSLAFHNKMQFSTFDRDHDSWEGNCASYRHGAWWYKICTTSNLNGLYKSDGSRGLDGVTWFDFENDDRSMKRVEMKIKESTLNWITHKFHRNKIRKK